MRKLLDVTRLLASIALMTIGVASVSVAAADPLDDTLARFAKDSFSETGAAIDEIAGSNVDHATALLEALKERRLLLDPSGAVFYKDTAGKVHDAKTGQEVATAPTGLKAVRVNNRLRGAINAALGAMTLASPNAAKRRSAAEAVFRSREVEALDAVRKAKAAEQDPGIATALAEAEASIVLAKSDATVPEKLSAIGVLKARGDQEALGLLHAVTNDPNREVAAAAATTIAGIERSLKLVEGIQNIWYGLSLGSVLLLAAIGLAITFGVMGVINMAHGEMVMLGAYTTFTVQEIFRAYAPGAFDYSLLVAVPAAFAVAGARRHRHRARHHPLPLRPAAGNPARHLGRQPDPAAGGAHALRRVQPRSRRAELHAGRLRLLRPRDHL